MLHNLKIIDDEKPSLSEIVLRYNLLKEKCHFCQINPFICQKQMPEYSHDFLANVKCTGGLFHNF